MKTDDLLVTIVFGPFILAANLAMKLLWFIVVTWKLWLVLAIVLGAALLYSALTR